jgi:hypothetical protein
MAGSPGPEAGLLELRRTFSQPLVGQLHATFGYLRQTERALEDPDIRLAFDSVERK